MQHPDSRDPHRWASVSDLVIALVGSNVKSIADRITYLGNQDKKKDDGRSAIPKQFVRPVSSLSARRGQRLEYLISPRSLTFFNNLLDLGEVLKPSDIAKLVRNESPRDLSASLNAGASLFKRRRDACVAWVSALPDLAARLDKGERIDLAAARLLDLPRVAPTEPPLTAAPSLHLLGRLEALDADDTRPSGEIAGDKALLLLSLGELDLAEGILEGAPDHPHVHYARAVTLLGRADRAARAGRGAATLAEEAGLRHEAHFEDDVFEHYARARAHRRSALAQLAKAYTSWPQQAWRGGSSWVDPLARERVMHAIIRLAFDFAHDHGSVDAPDLMNIAARRRGEAIGPFFDGDLDPVILEVARAQPRYAGFTTRTRVLQLFFVLSPGDYACLVPAWLEAFDAPGAADIVAALTPASLRNPFAAVVREHLQRNPSAPGGAEALGRLGERHTREIRETHERLRAFMTRDPADDFDPDL